MSDLTHDTTDDGFHEIQLSGKQLVFLFMAGTSLAVVIFLLGLSIGRGVRAARGEEPIDSAVASGAPAAAPDAAAEPASAEPPSPPAEDELSYHKRLQGGGAPEAVKTEPTPEPAPPAATPNTPPPAAPPAEAAPNVPTSGRPGTWVVQITALQNRASAAAIVQRLIGKGYSAYLELPAAGAPVIYRVRVGRFGDRSEAEQVVRRLQKEEQLTPVVTR